jgi:hypothetical protein
MSRFFINRPIVAIVVSIIMVIVGAITISNLPVAQFPNIAPPEIKVQAVYPGADAETMERAVATPMEQQINGVDNMDYMYSLNSTNNSSTALYVNFDLKTEPNADLLLTQSRQQLANGQQKSREFREHQEELVLAAQDAARLSELRYRGGATNYLEVLTNETNAFNAELGLTQAQLNELVSLVDIYRNLGGAKSRAIER